MKWISLAALVRERRKKFNDTPNLYTTLRKENKKYMYDKKKYVEKRFFNTPSIE